MRDRRSLLNFGVLTLVAIATTVFVLKKANDAIAEISALSSMPAYLGDKEAAGTSSVEDATTWKTYRNAALHYEVSYPASHEIFVSVSEKVVSGALERALEPPTAESKQIYISERPYDFLCCEPVYVKIEALDRFAPDLQALAEESKYITPSNAYRVKRQGYESFHGIPAYRISAEGGIDSPGDIILFNTRGRTFLIQATGGASDILAEKIIDSVKFFE